MGTYVNNGVVSLGTSYDYDDAVREIGQLLGVDPREDGMYNLADICQANSINKWAKYKPFAYPAWNFTSDTARDTARKGTPNTTGISYGLKIPIVNKVTSLSNNNDRWTYLVTAAGSYMMNATNPNAPNYQHIQPSGTEDGPNRLRDFDGYDHNSPMMPIWKAGVQYFNAGATHDLNRFHTPYLRFYIMAEGKGGAHLTLGDILQSPDNMRFVVEECVDTVSRPYYMWTRPTNIYVSSRLAKNVDYTGQFIDVPLDPANDGKQISFVFGINQINASTMKPYEANGLGMFAPHEGGKHWITFNQKMEFDLRIRPLRFATGAASPSWISLPNYDANTCKTTSPDIIVEMNVQKGNGYYILGSNFNGTLPSGATAYKFRMVNASSGKPFSTVVGRISNKNGQHLSPDSVFVSSKTSSDPSAIEYQTIYLKFDSAMPATGVYYSARLEASVDGGNTWNGITSGYDGLTFYITRQ